MPLAADTRRTYASRVRMYLAWLTERPATGGDPLIDAHARDWVVRDYRRYLLREADPKRSVRYVNNALAALDDFHLRRAWARPPSPARTSPRPRPRRWTPTRRSAGCAPLRTGPARVIAR
ncbi:hypothetical protein ACFXJ8_43960 [Nonomuraea sp. NPDC059194]|uniref:hypothetical protein n=1 Tax=Nonomuraea sp. NPDC059194 TaxID=3346764 RepID=UPI00369C3DB7